MSTLARERIARIFGVGIDALRDDQRFGSELRATRASDFAENELDRLLVDVHEMLDGVGDLQHRETVGTVGEFCALADNYERKDPRGFQRMVGRWRKEETMKSRPRWRRLLYWALGS